MDGSTSIKFEKERVREQIWKLLLEEGVAAPPFPIRGRIPNFNGSEKAAKNLDKVSEYVSAKVVLAAPDYVLFHARLKCLMDGKVLIMATPKIRKGYLLLDPKKIGEFTRSASTISGAFRSGKRIQEIMPPDFVIEGCVAVDGGGHRLGKGGGYGDKEIALARAKNPNVTVVVICSSKQVLDQVPFEEGDQLVDYIITEKSVFRLRR
ncbi:MAG: 5-formyltetrahydrofolate cyclo-ligase [Thermoproteota archaeon]